MCFYDGVWINSYGPPGDAPSVLAYLRQSPFWDAGSANEALMQRGARDPSDEAELARLAPRTEFVVAEARPPHLFVVQKRRRDAPGARPTLLMQLYVLDGVAYMCPSAGAVVGARVSRAAYRLEKALELFTAEAYADPKEVRAHARACVHKHARGHEHANALSAGIQLTERGAQIRRLQWMRRAPSARRVKKPTLSRMRQRRWTSRWRPRATRRRHARARRPTSTRVLARCSAARSQQQKRAGGSETLRQQAHRQKVRARSGEACERTPSCACERTHSLAARATTWDMC